MSHDQVTLNFYNILPNLSHFTVVPLYHPHTNNHTWIKYIAFICQQFSQTVARINAPFTLRKMSLYDCVIYAPIQFTLLSGQEELAFLWSVLGNCWLSWNVECLLLGIYYRSILMGELKYFIFSLTMFGCLWHTLYGNCRLI